MGALPALGLLATERKASAGSGTDVAGVVQVRRKKRLRRNHDGVIVYLEGVPGARKSTASAVLEVRQKDRAFTPDVSAVLVGTTLTFPNDDHIMHNVFSTSDAGRFDLGAYKTGTTKSFRTHKTGTIRIYCNMHPEMAATVLVLDTNYFAQTDENGRFVIPRVPPGTYRWVAWQPHGESVSGQVVVGAGGAESVQAELSETWPPRHRRKDGSHYDEY